MPRGGYVTAREHLLSTKRGAAAAAAARAPRPPPPAFLSGMGPPLAPEHAPPHARRPLRGAARQPPAAALQATLHLLLSPLTSAGASACCAEPHTGALSDYVV